MVCTVLSCSARRRSRKSPLTIGRVPLPVHRYAVRTARRRKRGGKATNAKGRAHLGYAAAADDAAAASGNASLAAAERTDGGTDGRADADDVDTSCFQVPRRIPLRVQSNKALATFHPPSRRARPLGAWILIPTQMPLSARSRPPSPIIVCACCLTLFETQAPSRACLHAWPCNLGGNEHGMQACENATARKNAQSAKQIASLQLFVNKV